MNSPYYTKYLKYKAKSRLYKSQLKNQTGGAWSFGKVTSKVTDMANQVMGKGNVGSRFGAIYVKYPDMVGDMMMPFLSYFIVPRNETDAMHKGQVLKALLSQLTPEQAGKVFTAVMQLGCSGGQVGGGMFDMFKRKPKEQVEEIPNPELIAQTKARAVVEIVNTFTKDEASILAEPLVKLIRDYNAGVNIIQNVDNAVLMALGGPNALFGGMPSSTPTMNAPTMNAPMMNAPMMNSPMMNSPMMNNPMMNNPMVNNQMMNNPMMNSITSENQWTNN